MNIKLNPYITFKDNARQAMEFYAAVFGGKLSIGTFKEFHASTGPKDENLIMHAELVTNDGLTIMASDTSGRSQYKHGTNFAISVSGDDEEALKGYYQKLSAGGTVTMPLQQATWGDYFGMVTDKFGISWYINITQPKK